MKISVVIPAYNAEKYIAQCIENILYQTHKDIEIIVVNDGSTDRTAEIAAAYPAVKLINQHNQGLSVARNVGTSAATGDYIHFMDADDLLNREYYECMVSAIGDGTAPVDMVFGGYINGIHPRQSIRFDDRLLLTTLDDKISFTNAGVSTYAWRYLIRRSFIEENKLRFELGRLFEDVQFTLDALALSGTVATAPGTTYHYMKRAGSILNTRDREHVRKRKEHYRYVKEWRRKYYERHGLGAVYKPRSQTIYKLLGIPLWSRVERNDGKVRWYLFDMCILQRRVKA